MTRAIALALLLLAGCQSRQTSNAYVAAANTCTRNYAQSRLSRWDIRARAIGADCNVLLIETKIILEDSMIEAMHYGAGAYDVDGGVDQFYRKRSFRGVVYKDKSGRIWTYGDVKAPEVPGMAACR